MGENQQLTTAEITAKMLHLERVSTTPLYSNVRRGSCVLKRIYRMRVGDGRSREETRHARLAVMAEEFSISNVILGHTHVADFDTFLTTSGKILRSYNTHCWTDKCGPWGVAGRTFGATGRGVAVIETGRDPNGARWSDTKLKKVIFDGQMVDGDIVVLPEKLKSQHKRDLLRVVQKQKITHAANAPEIHTRSQSLMLPPEGKTAEIEMPQTNSTQAANHDAKVVPFEATQTASY